MSMKILLVGASISAGAFVVVAATASGAPVIVTTRAPVAASTAMWPVRGLFDEGWVA